MPPEDSSEKHPTAHQEKKSFKFFPSKESVLSIRDFFCKEKEDSETTRLLKKEKPKLYLELGFVLIFLHELDVHCCTLHGDSVDRSGRDPHSHAVTVV